MSSRVLLVNGIKMEPSSNVVEFGPKSKIGLMKFVARD